MCPTLFDVGRAQLPPRVLAFASGVNEACEIRGFFLAHQDFNSVWNRVKPDGRLSLRRGSVLGSAPSLRCFPQCDI